MVQLQNRGSKIFNDKSRLRILHVDDDPSLQEITKSMLLDLNSCFEIETACCVDEAFEKLAIGNYDVVVSDYEMPQKDGLQFLKELREGKNNIPFILFTGKGREEIAVKALNLGANGYINKQGNPETVYGELSHNIKMLVEYNKTKNDLCKRDLRLTKLAAQTPGMLYQFLRRPGGVFCVPYASNNIQAIFGCSPQDVHDDFSPIAKVILPEDFEKVITSIEYSAAHMTPWQCEYRVQLPGQQIRWLLAQAIPELLEDGGVLWNGYNADISERKKAEELLLFKTMLLESQSETSIDGILVVNEEGQSILFNRRFGEIWQIPPDVLDTKEDEKMLKCILDQLKDPAEFTRKVTYLYEHKDEKSRDEVEFAGGRYLDRYSSPLLSSDGKYRGRIWYFRDITERKNAEEALRRSEVSYNKLINGMNDVTWVVDFEGKFVDVNNAAVKVLGYSKEELLSFGLKDVDKFLSPEQAMDVMGRVVSVGRQVFETVHTTKDGTPIPVEISASVITYCGKQVILGVARDISERRKDQEELRASEENFRMIFEGAPDGILVENAKTKRFVFANSRICELTGYSLEELLKLKVSDIHPEKDWLHVENQFRKHLERKITLSPDIPILRKDKRVIYCDVIAKPAIIRGQVCWVGFFRDTIDQKKDEDQLKMTAHILDLAHDAIFVRDIKDNMANFDEAA